jgi:hypothetical protein
MRDTVSQGCGHPSGGHGDEDMERSGPPEGWPLAGKHVAYNHYELFFNWALSFNISIQ